MPQAEFTVTIGGLTHEAALALADQIDENHATLAVSVNETDERNAVWETIAYVETTGECGDLQAVYAHLNPIVAALPDENWVEKSLRGLAPVTAGRFFLYGSHDRAKRRAGGVSLEIDAGTAFGTGHHATTTGCLLALDHILKHSRPKNIFDLGCGTGVLAIAAQKVARSAVLATDIDVEATRVTYSNQKTNSISPRLRTLAAAGLLRPEIPALAPFDLIFANILARPLERLASGIANLLAPGGRVVLSGITTDQKRWIVARYRNQGLVFERAYMLNGWAALVMRRGRPSGPKRPCRYPNA